jgi:hypothetical protein
MEAIIVYMGIAMAITLIETFDSLKNQGYNPSAVDRDKDGWIQEGTKWERRANSR